MEAMILLHESDGRAFTMAAAAHERRLTVVEGRAWVTRSRRRAGDPVPDDLWLVPGDTLVLPAGSAWVVQAVGALRLRLCEPAFSGTTSSVPAWVSGLVAVARAAWPARLPAH